MAIPSFFPQPLNERNLEYSLHLIALLCLLDKAFTYCRHCLLFSLWEKQQKMAIHVVGLSKTTEPSTKYVIKWSEFFNDKLKLTVREVGLKKV